ncbi:MAG: tRNA glutamyl-Q(34) synthetase GluQRS [Microthrixaceae bacterium]
MTVGRFAPSPSGPLHLGNLRTALLAWCFARSEGGRFLVRMEDLTTGAAPVAEAGQLADLATLGLDHDGPVERQSGRRALHDAALARLVDAGLTYECFCSRREIREAAAAPHGPSEEGRYPGTCRGLTGAERAECRATGRAPALRLRAEGARVAVTDRLLGTTEAVVDDIVLRRADGVVAYNLAVVVDDADQGVDQVVRGDDLWHATPAQALLQDLLELPRPSYAHVPLVLGADGDRLAKRHGAVTLADRTAAGESSAATLGLLAASLGLAEPGEEPDAATVLGRFRPDRLPTVPWVLGG